MKTSLLIALTIVGLIGATARGVAAEQRRFDATSLWAEAVTADLRPSDDGNSLELDTGELIEDDGPAAGYSYQPNEEKLGEGIRIRKTLLLDDPRAMHATLLIGGSGTFEFEINGSPVDLPPGEQVGGYWQSYALPTENLRAGANEIVVSGTGKIWIAREEDYAAGSTTRTRHPNRSAKSSDGGKTWDHKRLGTGNDLDGEYYIRLYLDRHRPGGTLTLPVVDVGNLAGDAIGRPLAAIATLRVRYQADEPVDTSVSLRGRTSPVPMVDSAEWSDWQSIEADGSLNNPTGRYLQIAVELQTDNPLVTPAIREVIIEAETTPGDDWTDRVSVLQKHNESIVRTSIPFAYEPYDHPHLLELRKRYALDEVTEGATSEWALITRLAAWSAGRWKRIGHLGEAYPPWNALEILRPHADGTPVGGFCQQYNLVFLQACESYGLAGRAVSLGPGTLRDKIRSGHEVVEIWSNEHRKWVYVDGNYAWYFVDRESSRPLSLLELRERQLAALHQQPHRPVRLVRIIDTVEPWDGLTSKPPFAELRLIPRSNFLEAASPLPLNQGMRGWFWTGHHVWTDELMPAAPLYDHRVTNRRNWQWTLNQAHFVLEATAEPGTLQVHLDTETPNFDTFIAQTDETQSHSVDSGFLWKLHAGTNSLTVRPRNTAGREGIASEITLRYDPPK